MPTTSSSLSRLTEEWPGWSNLFEGWLARPEMMRMLDLDRIRVEEIRRDDAMVVRAELPGIDPEKDIEVSITEGVLEIHASREEREESKEEGRYRSEFRYGSFVRRLPLPAGASEGEISATYHDGILEVTVPMQEPEPTEQQTIPIQRA
jgi:HSP20 family protein